MSDVVCDAYSGGCVTPGPTLFPSTAPPVTPAPALPRTGPTGGDVVTLLLLALMLIITGVVMHTKAGSSVR